MARAQIRAYFILLPDPIPSFIGYWVSSVVRYLYEIIIRLGILYCLFITNIFLKLLNTTDFDTTRLFELNVSNIVFQSLV